MTRSFGSLCSSSRRRRRVVVVPTSWFVVVVSSVTLLLWLRFTAQAAFHHHSDNHALRRRVPPPPLPAALGQQPKMRRTPLNKRWTTTSIRAAASVDAADTTDAMSRVERLKVDLLRACGGAGGSPTGDDGGVAVAALVRELELAGQASGIGQWPDAASALLGGEWELVACSEDVTRSSPFFWAFRNAIPTETANEILGFTDAIPAPLKEVGPAFQYIDWNAASGTGRLVSKVKVATLGGFATSVMTTRATLVGPDGSDRIRVKVDTTKPEESTILSTLLGPFGAVVNENVPAFPSGATLEALRPGSSEVILRTTFCDEGLRVSRYGSGNRRSNSDGDTSTNSDSNYCVWRRREFASFDFL